MESVEGGPQSAHHYCSFSHFYLPSILLLPTTLCSLPLHSSFHVTSGMRSTKHFCLLLNNFTSTTFSWGLCFKGEVWAPTKLMNSCCMQLFPWENTPSRQNCWLKSVLLGYSAFLVWKQPSCLVSHTSENLTRLKTHSLCKYTSPFSYSFVCGLCFARQWESQMPVCINEVTRLD